MKFSENWLRELVDRVRPITPRLLEPRAFNMTGLEVEESSNRSAPRSTASSSPRSSRARSIRMPTSCSVCQVVDRQASTLQIVCGAPNARAGLKAPLATVGAKLPSGIEIKKAALRGVESSGMLCSAKELGIDADASGLLELPGDAPVGKSLRDYLGLPDAGIELKLTPNRADCLSLRGLAHRRRRCCSTRRSSPTEIEAVAAAIERTRRRAPRTPARIARAIVGRVIEGVDATAADAVLDGRTLAPQRHPSGQPPRRRHPVRDARTRPADACVRRGETARRHRRAPRAQRTKRSSCSTAREYTLDAEFLVIADAKERVGARRHHGRTRFARHRHDARRLPRSRALRAGGDHGPRAQARAAHGCVASLRARRRSGIAAHRDRARDATCSVDRRRHSRARSAKPNIEPIAAETRMRCRCAARVCRACSASASPMPTVERILTALGMRVRAHRRRLASARRRRAASTSRSKKT